MLFLIKASLILAILWAFYKVILENESFFKVNRIYLLGTLFFACILPFVSLPKMIEHQGYIEGLLKSKNKDKIAVEGRKKSIEDTNNIVPANSKITGANEIISLPSESSNIPVPAEPEPSIAENPPVQQLYSLSDWLWWIYWFGAGVLAINLLAQIVGTMFRALTIKDFIEDEDYIIVNLPKPSEPCSFFKYIFIHPDSYEFDTYEQIIDHEKIHVQQKHSLDLLLGEIAVIFFWFNPISWWLRKEIEKNVEYQTDELLLKKEPEQKKGYQLNLLKIGTYNKPLAITTNYNQSLLKQRIMKMNSKKSNPYSYWKYTFLVPILVGVLLLINAPNGILALNTDGEEQATIQEFSTNSQASVLPSDTTLDERLDMIFKKMEKDPEGFNSYHLSVALIGVIHQKSVTIVNDLIANGADVNFHNDTGWTPLMEAAKTGAFEIAHILIKKGVDVNARDNQGWTALLEATEKGNVQLAELLIENGAEIDLSVNKFDIGDQEHDIAFDFDHESFNSNGTEFGYNTSENCERLIVAIQDQNTLEIKKILELVDPNCTVYNEDSEAQYENNEVVYIRSPRSPLVTAARVGNVNIGKLLLEANADMELYGGGDEPPLIAAAAMGNLDFVKLLIANGASINKFYGGTGEPQLVLYTSVKGHTPTYLDYLKSEKEIKSIVAGYGTALMAAQRNDQEAVKKFLLANGAVEMEPSVDKNEMDVEMDVENQVEIQVEIPINEQSCKTLLRATKSNQIETVGELLKNVNPDCTYRRDGEPRSALVAAARKGYLEIGKLIVENGGSPDYHSSGDETPLMAAAKYGHFELVQYLIGKGAEINKEVGGDGTALLVAAGEGHAKIVQYLIEQGAEVNAAVRGDGTPLIVAVKGQHYEAAKILLENGADPYQNVPGDEYPMYHARVSGNKKMIDLLKNYDK